jgi:hypothetical protein
VGVPGGPSMSLGWSYDDRLSVKPRGPFPGAMRLADKRRHPLRPARGGLTIMVSVMTPNRARRGRRAQRGRRHTNIDNDRI